MFLKRSCPQSLSICAVWAKPLQIELHPFDSISLRQRERRRHFEAGKIGDGTAGAAAKMRMSADVGVVADFRAGYLELLRDSKFDEKFET